MLLILFLTSALSQISTSSNIDVCSNEECTRVAGVILNSLDRWQDPCDDFHKFSCGGLEYSSSAVYATRMVYERNKLKYSAALLDMSNSSSSSMRLASVLYLKCLTADSTVEYESFGNSELTATLVQLVYDDYAGVEDMIRIGMLAGQSSFIRIGFTAFGVKSEELLVIYTIGPLKLKNQEMVDNIFDQYAEPMLGTEMALVMQQVLVDMTQIAEGERASQIKTLQQLIDLTPNIKWTAVFGSDTARNSTIHVGATDEWLLRLDKIVGSTNGSVLKGIALIHQLVNYFTYFEKLAETETDESTSSSTRSQLCSDMVSELMPRTLNIVIAKSYLTTKTRDSAQSLTDDVRAALGDLLQKGRWFGDETTKSAVEKINAVKAIIGYPDGALDTTKEDELWEEVALASKSLNLIDLYRSISQVNALHTIHHRIGKPLFSDISHLLNKFDLHYMPPLNGIAVPTLVLQSPVFEPHGPLFYQYGFMGALIGHELVHALDTKGWNFDKRGRMRDWISEENKDKVILLADCLVEMYSNYSLRQGRVNGTRTLNENMADIGGLSAAFLAYIKRVENHLPEMPLIGLEDFSSEQLFFLSFAQTFCGGGNEGIVDPTKIHSPEYFRLIGAVSNSKEFAKAFNCPIGSAMNPAKKCPLWSIP